MTMDTGAILEKFYYDTVYPYAKDTSRWLEIDDDAINVLESKNGKVIERLVYPVQGFEDYWYDWLSLCIRNTRRRLYGGFPSPY